MATRNIHTTYETAVHWLHNNLILCNEISSNLSTSDSLEYRFEWEAEDEDGNVTYTEIYQYFLTDCSMDDVEYLEEHFGLLFAYFDTLDLFVLCVPHWGTAWGAVDWETDLEYARV